MRELVHFYKPKGISSFQFVSRVGKLIGAEKAGHGGALDPLAEGVLVIGLGRSGTKQLAGFLNNETKEYEAVVRLGEVSETDDGEGPIIENPNSQIKIPKQTIEEFLKRFVGEIEQVPPKYSAIRTGGKRAYSLARKGKEVILEPRRVFIEKIEITGYQSPDLRLRIVCGSGVYIRSLARDLGKALGVGAYLKELKRTRVGDFLAEDAIRIEDLEKNPRLLD